MYELIEADMRPRQRYNHALSGFQRLQICLRFLASGDYFLAIGDQYGVSKQTVASCVWNGVRAIVRRLYRHVVQWPRDAAACDEIRARFTGYVCAPFSASSTYEFYAASPACRTFPGALMAR
jgi:hypothetical protein